MSEDLMLKCLIAFILGWIVCRMMGEGFSVGADEDPMCQNKGKSEYILDRCTYLPDDSDCHQYVESDSATDWKPGMKLYNCGDRWKGKCSNDGVGCKQDCSNVCNNNGTGSWNKETRVCDCKCNQGYSGRFCETDIAKEKENKEKEKENKENMKDHIKEVLGRAQHFSDLNLNKYCKDLTNIGKDIDESYLRQLRLNLPFCTHFYRAHDECSDRCNIQEGGMRDPYTADLKGTCLRQTCEEGKHYFPNHDANICWTIDDIIDAANCNWSTDAET